MNSHPLNYKEFLHAIKNDELVYLFGTGISSALTGKRYSWYKWISDGIDYIKDSKIGTTLRASLNADTSTENMVYVAGKVLKQTKIGGTYAEWMHNSFEVNKLTNDKLANILKKLLMTQDVFATTNYDLLLEKATGLESLSYDNTDLTFAMLDKHISTAVLHIHGIYDSVNDIDNIIADNEQYNAILDDKGAQFIQGLLGTRTLVFVGCGKTSEDANISRFVKFANEYLKLHKTYYFLYCSKNPVEGLSDNIVPISFGDEYGDLPVFLEELAQIRIQHRIQSPLIGRNPYKKKTDSFPRLQQYHFASASIPFCGRKAELRELSDFIENDEKFSWWAITGQAGAGKSRLALEFISKLPVSWFGFFAADSILQKDIEEYKPFCSTVIVIDYVAGRERKIADAICKLKERFAVTGYKLKILLLERSDSKGTGSWYSKLLQRLPNSEAETVKSAEFKEKFLNLRDLDKKDVATLIGEVCNSKGFTANHERDLFLTAAYEKKYEELRFRPLFVQLFVEAWIANDCEIPRYDDFTEILTEFLQREQKKWLEAVEGKQQVCNAFVHLLLRANISGFLDTSKLPEIYDDDWKVINSYVEANTFPGGQRTEWQYSLINAFCQNINEENILIAPSFPDLIKEYMFFLYSEEERLPEVMTEIWQNAAFEFSIFITRCLTDFPNQDFFKKALNKYNNAVVDFEVLKGRLELLQGRLIKEDDDPEVLLDIIDNEHEFWRNVVVPKNETEETVLLAIIKITALNQIAVQYGAWSLYNIADMIEAIEEMLSVEGGNAAKIYQKVCLQEHIKNLSVSSFFDEVEYLQNRLNELIESTSEDELDAFLLSTNDNAKMMELLLDGKLQEAEKLLKEMATKCDYSALLPCRVLAHSCFNLSHFSFMMGAAHAFKTAYSIVKSVEVLFPEDIEIRARRIGCEGSELTHNYFSYNISDEQIAPKLNSLEREVDGFRFMGEETDEALSLSWAIVKTLCINVADKEKDKKKLKEIISEADCIIKKHPKLSDIANVKIMATRSLYIKIYKQKIPHVLVEELFKHVEANYDSETLREQFFDMLEESEDAEKRADYITERIAFAARQDARYNPLHGSGLAEFDYEADILWNALHSQEPYVRPNRKIGVNEPCPCGSGKKFKKCCRGKGLIQASSNILM